MVPPPLEVSIAVCRLASPAPAKGKVWIIFAWWHCAAVKPNPPRMYTFDLEARSYKSGSLTKTDLLYVFRHCDPQTTQSDFRVLEIRLPPAEVVARTRDAGLGAYEGMAANPDRWQHIRDALGRLQAEEAAGEC